MDILSKRRNHVSEPLGQYPWSSQVLRYKFVILDPWVLYWWFKPHGSFFWRIYFPSLLKHGALSWILVFLSQRTGKNKLLARGGCWSMPMVQLLSSRLSTYEIQRCSYLCSSFSLVTSLSLCSHKGLPPTHVFTTNGAPAKDTSLTHDQFNSLVFSI